MDNRASLYQHIVLSGGSTMLPGLTSRLERDIKALYVQRVLKVELSTAAHASLVSQRKFTPGEDCGSRGN